MTRIWIQLSDEDVECLLRYLPPESSVRTKLKTLELPHRPGAAPGGPTHPFQCDEAEAFELMAVAREHCDESLREITKGIKQAWPDI